MKIVLELNTAPFSFIFDSSVMFLSAFSSSNNLIRQKNTLWKVDEIVFQSEITSREVASDTKGKSWQTGPPGKA